MAFHREVSLALAAARRGAVEHRQMPGVEPGRPFERHGSAGIFVGGVDLPLGEADLGQEVKIRLVDALSRQLERPSEEGLAEGPFVEGEFDVEGGRHRLLYRCDILGGEAARGERLVIDAWSAGERAAADGIVDDALDVSLVID